MYEHLKSAFANRRVFVVNAPTPEGKRAIIEALKQDREVPTGRVICPVPYRRNFTLFDVLFWSIGAAVSAFCMGVALTLKYHTHS